MATSTRAPSASGSGQVTRSRSPSLSKAAARPSTVTALTSSSTASKVNTDSPSRRDGQRQRRGSRQPAPGQVEVPLQANVVQARRAIADEVGARTGEGKRSRHVDYGRRTLSCGTMSAREPVQRRHTSHGRPRPRSTPSSPTSPPTHACSRSSSRRACCPRPARWCASSSSAAVVIAVRYVLDLICDADALTVDWTFVEGEIVTDSVGGWRFTAAGDGTNIDYRAALDVKAPLPGFVLRKVTDGLVAASLPNMFASIEREVRRRQSEAGRGRRRGCGRRRSAACGRPTRPRSRRRCAATSGGAAAARRRRRRTARCRA